MKVNVASFFSHKMPNKMGIANGKVGSIPNVIDFGDHFRFLIPPWALVDDYRNGRITWEEYEAVYKSRLEGKNLKKGFEWLGGALGVNELTLCCFERVPDFCHRRLVWEALPIEIRGELK